MIVLACEFFSIYVYACVLRLTFYCLLLANSQDKLVQKYNQLSLMHNDMYKLCFFPLCDINDLQAQLVKKQNSPLPAKAHSCSLVLHAHMYRYM